MAFLSAPLRAVLALAVLTAALSSPLAAKTKTPKVRATRLYVFDCGTIKGLSPAQFNLKPEEVTAKGFVVPCYLVVHKKGTLMWDTGVIPDSAFKADGAPVTQGISTVTKPLLPQLAKLGYAPGNIRFLAMSHYHSDHDANANAFEHSTWLVRKEERDVMFAEKPQGIMQPSHYSALRNSKTILIDTDEYDVFGDKSVIIKYAPGHTPGHQVLLVKLKRTGPILVAGDLYHYPEEKTLDRYPTFEYSKEQSSKSRKDIDEYLKRTKAKMWIEHDQATFDKLKKAPAFYE
jgi:N-acyl homoserine lactone hydrolase